MAKGFRTWDDYFIPGTSVLRNIENIADGEQLRRYEEAQALHRHIFQDVYAWAGEERVGLSDFMTKDGHAYYPGGPSLTAAAETEYGKLASKDLLRGLDKDQFVDELAEQAGYQIDTEAFKAGSPLRDEFVQARFHSQDTGSNSRLAAVLSKAIEPIQTTPAVPAPLSPELQKIVDLNKRNYPTSATEIGRTAAKKSPEARGYQPPAQGLSSGQGYGR